MPGWVGSDRREHLPKNWDTLRKRRLTIDGHRCTAKNTYGERCEEEADEVDHIGDRDDHRLEKLRSLCSWHHGKKSGREGAAASRARRKAHDQKFRRTEAHPGLL